MNSLASLLLQGSSSDSCHNDQNPLSALSKTFDQQPHAQHQFQSTRSHHHQQPIRTTSDHLIIQQQLTQEQHNSQPVPPQLSEQFKRLQLGNHQLNWSTAFLKSVPIQSFLHSEHSSSNDHHPPWQSEFTQPHHSSKLAHQRAPIPTQSNILPATSQLGPSTFSQLGPLPPHHHPYHPIRSTHLISQGSSIQNPTTTPAVDWDSAFLKYDAHDAPTATVEEIQHRIEQDQITQESTFLSRSHSPISSTSPDALAKTAASLISTVENGQRAHNYHEADPDQATSSQNAHDTATADKFNQSSFMEFMRQLRDGEVKVEGDKVVQQLAPVKGSSSTVDTSTQMNNSIDHLQQQTQTRLSTNNYPQDLNSFCISGDPLSEPYHPPQLNDQPSVSQPPSPDQLLAAYRDNLESRIREMNDIMEETDTEIERTQYQAMMNRFQGDGGGLSDLDDILNAASEVDRPEEQTWTNTATHVPGATESWTEEFDQDHGTSAGTSAREKESSDFDEMGMFGRPIHAREFELERLKRLQRLPSAQQQEWEKLQSDWEVMANTLEDPALGYSTTSTSAISPATCLERIMTLKAETGYNFQQANPHIFLRQDQAIRSKHHSTHQPWQESTLEHLSISPLESVLQKEKEVLSKPESATAWYELGVKQQENEREEMAIHALQHAIKLDPELSDAILALAISYSNENRRAEAFEEIERWIRVETSRVPKYRQVALGRPPSQLKTGADDPKNGAIEESLKLGVKHRELTDRLIELARLGGRMAGTASVDPDVQIALGVLFNSNDEFEKACDCFSTALAVRPNDPLLFNRLGATLANSGKPEEAIEYYNKAIELLPSYIRARYNLSISLINLGKYFESIKNLLDSLIIQQQASLSLSAPDQHLDQSDHQGPLHLLSGAEQQQSGVTSDVLWQTLEVNCSLLNNHFAESQAALDDCFLNKDLDRLKEILVDFL